MRKCSPSDAPVLSIIVPCYNEEEIIEWSANTLSDFLNSLKKEALINNESYLCFVDDGSKDKTYETLNKLRIDNQYLRIIKLSRNFGHQAAILAGLKYAKKKCDCAITIDADLQDDHTTIKSMIEKFNTGSEIVYGIRNIRTSDSNFKRITARIFYKIMEFLGAKTIKDHADYRLLSQRAIKFLFKHKEVNIFIRGLVPEIGLKTDTVYYERSIRIAGETKYPFKKMLAFAIEGITSFSVKPLRLVTFLGIIIILLSLLVAIYILVSFLLGAIIVGWTSTIISIWFLGGVQLLSLGIIGEYIGKIYKESKERPIFLIEEIVQ